LLITSRIRPFIERDKKILSERYHVICLSYKSIKDLIIFLKEFFNANLLIFWFGGYIPAILTIIAKIFKKKTITIAGGGGFTGIKKINYGNLIKIGGILCAKILLNFSDKVLTVSKTMVKQIRNIDDKFKVDFIYHGVDTDFFKIKNKKNRKIDVLTVSLLKKTNIVRKRLDLFINVARLFPDKNFVIVGKILDKHIFKKLIQKKPFNLSFTGYVSENKLVNIYNNSKIFLQISEHEAFGIALAEAMACGCIPVTNKKAATPEIVGELGILVNNQNINEIAKGIDKALKLGFNRRKMVRSRIVNHFSMKKRKTLLLKYVKKVLNKKF